MCFPWAGAFAEIFVNFSNRNSFMKGRRTNTDFLLNSDLVIASKSKQTNSGRMGFLLVLCPFKCGIIF